jgi:hypothetical protein
MFARRTEKCLDVIKYVLPCGIACKVRSWPDPFSCLELEKALLDGIITARPMSTHAWVQIALFRNDCHSILEALGKVDHHFLFGLSGLL